MAVHSTVTLNEKWLSLTQNVSELVKDQHVPVSLLPGRAETRPAAR